MSLNLMLHFLPHGRCLLTEKSPVAVTAPGISAKGFGKKRGRKEDLRSYGNAESSFPERLRLTASATFLLLRYFLVLNIE